MPAILGLLLLIVLVLLFSSVTLNVAGFLLTIVVAGFVGPAAAPGASLKGAAVARLGAG